MAFEATDRHELRAKLEEYAATGDKVLRDEIVASQVGLAEYLARRFKNRGEPIEDLIQVALLGLLKAVERFDPGRGLERAQIGLVIGAPPRCGPRRFTYYLPTVARRRMRYGCTSSVNQSVGTSWPRPASLAFL